MFKVERIYNLLSIVYVFLATTIVGYIENMELAIILWFIFVIFGSVFSVIKQNKNPKTKMSAIDMILSVGISIIGGIIILLFRNKNQTDDWVFLLLTISIAVFSPQIVDVVFIKFPKWLEKIGDNTAENVDLTDIFNRFKKNKNK